MLHRRSHSIPLNTNFGLVTFQSYQPDWLVPEKVKIQPCSLFPPGFYIPCCLTPVTDTSEDNTKMLHKCYSNVHLICISLMISIALMMKHLSITSCVSYETKICTQCCITEYLHNIQLTHQFIQIARQLDHIISRRQGSSVHSYKTSPTQGKDPVVRTFIE